MGFVTTITAGEIGIYGRVRYGASMPRADESATRNMHSQFNPWKTAIAVVIYVVLCMVVLCFAPPDYAASSAPGQNHGPASKSSSGNEAR